MRADGAKFLHSIVAALALVASATGVEAQREPTDGPPPAPPGPSISAAPEAAAPGMPLPVSGSGFEKSCGVEIVLEPTDPGGGYAAASGSGRGAPTTAPVEGGAFSTPWSVAAGVPAGDYRLLARGRTAASEEYGAPCTSPSGEEAETPFTVLPAPPSVRIVAPEVRPGTSIQLDGSGFCAAGCGPVTVLVDGIVAVAEAPVSASGVLTVAVPIPAVTTDGPVILEAVQTDAEGRQLAATAELIVTVRPQTRPEPVQ